jgi:Fuc2NAc and GlcNAc transferase
MGKLLIICSLLSFFSSLLFAALTARHGLKAGLIDTPNERSSHTAIIPRSGGIGIWLAFILVVILFTKYQTFAILAGIVGLIGLLEDRFSISQKIRLVSMLIISTLVVSSFIGIPASVIPILLSLFWIVFIAGTANFYNFMDGIDGIAGLTGFVSFGFMAVFSFYIVDNLDVALISMTLSVGCLGFLPFNIPKARVFMGDTGSVFLGFVFASLVIKLSTNISIFLCIIMFLCVFYADALVTIFYRWRRGENILIAHRCHLYQYMCNELKLSHWKVSLMYVLIQFVFGLLALLAYGEGVIWQIIVFLLHGAIFLIIYKYIKRISPGFVLN